MQLRLFITISFTMIFFCSEAQNKKIDSLRFSLAGSEADTNRVKTYISLALQLRIASRFDSSIVSR